MLLLKVSQQNCVGKQKRRRAYSAVGGLVHVSFHLSGIGHQVLHSTVLERSRIWSREDGLDAVGLQAKRKNMRGRTGRAAAGKAVNIDLK